MWTSLSCFCNRNKRNNLLCSGRRWWVTTTCPSHFPPLLFHLPPLCPSHCWLHLRGEQTHTIHTAILYVDMVQRKYLTCDEVSKICTRRSMTFGTVYSNNGLPCSFCSSSTWADRSVGLGIPSDVSAFSITWVSPWPGRTERQPGETSVYLIFSNSSQLKADNDRWRCRHKQIKVGPKYRLWKKLMKRQRWLLYNVTVFCSNV